MDLRFRRARCPPFLPTRSRRRRRWRTSRPAPRCWEERRAVSTRRPSASSHRSLRSAAARSWEYPAAASNLLRRPQSTSSSSLALKPSSSEILWTSSGRREARPTGKNIIMQGGSGFRTFKVLMPCNKAVMGVVWSVNSAYGFIILAAFGANFDTSLGRLEIL